MKSTDININKYRRVEKCARKIHRNRNHFNAIESAERNDKTEISCLHFFFVFVEETSYLRLYGLRVIAACLNCRFFWALKQIQRMHSGPICCLAPNRESLSFLSLIHIETIVCLLLFLLLIFFCRRFHRRNRLTLKCGSHART